MELTVRPEPQLDFAHTASLANQAFGAIGQAFTPERLEWLYRRAFSHGTLVLGLFSGDQKVGQVALLGQSMRLGAGTAPAVALVDLFILPDFRSRDAISALYGRVEAVCRERGIRFILAVPNGKAMGVNRKFLGLNTAATLDIRAGIGVPLRTPRVTRSAAVADLDVAGAQALFEPFAPRSGVGLAWTAASLWERLRDPASGYATHATDDLLLISTAKTRRRLPMTLLCGFLPRHGTVAGRADVRALVSAACLLHRRPAFVYIGRNTGVPLPGWRVPARLRPSVMIVQARDLAPDASPLVLDRFELMDFDFA